MVVLIMIGFLLLYLGGCYAAYRFTFYSPNKTQNDDRSVGDSRQMRPYRDKVLGMIDRLNSRPYERVSIRSRDGLRLNGRYYHQAENAPLAICFHGYRGTPSRDFSGGAQILLDQGYNLLMIEERAQCSSEGHTITFGVMERYDCLDWCRYAVERFGSEKPILLVGISMGAATVLMASALPLPDSVRGIVADCPYTSPPAIIKKVGRDLKLPDAVTCLVAPVSARLFGGFDWKAADAEAAVRHSRVPILLIHGEEDHFVPMDMSLKIKAANPEQIEFHSFPGAGHGMSYMLDTPRYERLIRDFGDRVLRGKTERDTISALTDKGESI